MNHIPFKIKLSFKGIFTENKGLKLIALLISLGLFTAVRMQEKVERWVDVDVEVVMPADEYSLALSNKPITSVRIQIRGRNTIVESIKNDNHVVKMDLSKYKRPGLYTFFFESEMFDFKGVDILDISPDAVSVRMENVISRKLTVEIDTVGTLKDGTVFESKPEVSPAIVLATGPASVIRSVAMVKTEDVGIDDLEVGKYSQDVPLVPVKGLKFSNDRFTVKFNIIEKKILRTFSGLIVQSGIDGKISVKIKPETVLITLLGPQRILEKLDASLIIPKAVLTDKVLSAAGKFTADVTLTGLDESIEVKAIVPPVVEVEISK
ncbi:MAG: hypothetical protein JXR91_04480 [Deltaproteobacteria bacterium]|nr:hypothetical protein [Deltaproteobacteria bacterium]